MKSIELDEPELRASPGGRRKSPEELEPAVGELNEPVDEEEEKIEEINPVRADERRVD